MKIDPKRIRMDGSTQPRESIDQGVVLEYSEAMKGGASFPPPAVFYDGTSYWLADGYHRVMAWMVANPDQDMEVDVQMGERRDAVLHSVGANATHGLRRTNADKRRSVVALLTDDEWSTWSDRKIAGRCKVHHSTVSDIRAELAGSVGNRQMGSCEVRTVERGGKTFAMKVGGINAGRGDDHEASDCTVDPEPGPPVPVTNDEVVPAVQQEPDDNPVRVRSSVLGEVGNLAAPPGSREWAVAVRMHIQSTVNGIKGQVDHLASMVGLLKEHHGIEQLDDRSGRPYGDFDAFVRGRQPFGLECEPEWLARMLGESVTEHTDPRAPSTAGYRGVRFDYRSGKYLARRMIGGIRKDLGYFATPEEAHAAYIAAGNEPIASPDVATNVLFSQVR